jgi:ubiquinone biosynthesis protein
VASNVLWVAANDWAWRAAGLHFATLGFSMLFAMLAAVMFDFAARPGSLAHGDRAGLILLPRPVRELRRRLVPYARYREIIRIARRNGLVPPIRPAARRRAAARHVDIGSAIRTTLEQGGVVLVKLGQMASTRSDLLPRDLTSELTQLQNHVAPAPREAMQVELENELGGPVSDFFAEFNWEPLGSASIAHTYGARLHDGQAIVVKVQRPGIEKIVDRDTAALVHLARTLERRTPQGRQLRVGELAEEFGRNLRNELDFQLEAESEVELGQFADPTGGVRIPRVYRQLCTRRMLVQERLDGASIEDELHLNASNVDRAELADRLVRAFMLQVMHGRFHADPHPGNVLLLHDGTLGLIDFGSTGRLDPLERAALMQMAVAIMNGDSDGLHDAIEQVTYVGAEVPQDRLQRALAHFANEHSRATGANALNDLIPFLETFEIRLPSEFTMLFRALVLLDGTAQVISPGYPLAEAITRLAGVELSDRRHAPTARHQLVQSLLHDVPRLRRLPAHVDRLATLATRGELQLRLALFSTPRDAQVVTTLVNRVVLCLVGASIALGSGLLLLACHGSTASTSVSVARVLSAVGFSLGAVLLLRVVAAIVREGFN